jgi:hypothetical protein
MTIGSNQIYNFLRLRVTPLFHYEIWIGSHRLEIRMEVFFMNIINFENLTLSLL